MNLDNNVTTDRADGPLTRADIELRIQNVGGSNRLDVSGQNLEGIDLSEANLSGANLSGANLSGANLSGAHFIKADLSEADLSGANLNKADLSGSSLSGTLITAESKEDLLHAIGVQWST